MVVPSLEAAIETLLLGEAESLRVSPGSGFPADEDLDALGEALGSNVTLTSLDLSENEIGDDGVQALAGALERNSTLTSLRLHWNGISCEGLENLSSTLSRNASLRKLDLSGNEIGQEGASCISTLLGSPSCGLNDLDVSSCDLGWEGIASLFEALSTHPKLEALNVGHNTPRYLPATPQQQESAIESLCTLLSKPGTILSDLRVAGNKLPEHTVAKVAEVLRRNTALRVLDLSESGLINEDLVALLEVLREENRTLMDLGRFQQQGAWASGDLDPELLEGVNILLGRNANPSLVLTLQLKRLQDALVGVSFTKLDGQVACDGYGNEVTYELRLDEPLSTIRRMVKDRLEPPGCCANVVLPDGRLLHHVSEDSTLGAICP